MKRLITTLCAFMVFMLVTCGLSSASTEQPDVEDSVIKKDWYIGPRIGLSFYTGIIGIEVQHHHLAFGVGLPGNIGVKYYVKPDGHSWFLGAYYMHFETASSDFEYAPGYDGDTTWDEGGLGGGYRWRWGTGWDLSLSFAGAYGERKERSGPAERIEKFIGIRPGVTFGYSF